MCALPGKGAMRERKRFVLIVLTAALAIMLLSMPAMAFSDTCGHWAEKSIQKWSEQYQILRGYTDGTFHPDGTITRGEFAAILQRFLQYREKSTTGTFSDTAASWCEESVLKLHAAGVYLGASGKATISERISRQQAVTMIARAFQIQESPAAPACLDANQIADYASGFVSAMLDLGYLTGNVFRPSDAITRAEVVNILDRMIAVLVQTAEPVTEDISGTLMVNSVEGSTLEGMTVTGDLVIAPGVIGTVTLRNAVIYGKIKNLGSAKIDADQAQISTPPRPLNPSPPPVDPIPGYSNEEYFTYHGQKIPIAKNVQRNLLRAGDFRWASDGRLSCTATGVSARFGIDVSAHQNNNTPGKWIDWNAVAADGVDFALIRAAYRGYESGGLREDDFFRQNVSGALSAGIDTGVYVFSQAISVEEAVEEADFILELLRDYQISGPIVYDWEIGNDAYRAYHVDQNTATAAAVAFCKRITDAGYTPMVYCSQTTGYLKFNFSRLSDYLIWYPEYETGGDGNGCPDFYYQMDCWQYSDKARIRGIGGSVDANLWFSYSDDAGVQNPAQSGAASSDWNLLLVNPWNLLPDNFSIELTTLYSGHSIDRRAYPALQEMMDDARAQGLSPVICSSYRTMKKQTELFQNKINRLIASGYSRTEAEREAAKWVAVPGTSEHQSGLALDIVALNYQNLDRNQANTAEQKWLIANSYKYGFILRYPENKAEITGIGYEPWHYRYVGVEAATEIYNREICLEEYLQHYR